MTPFGAYIFGCHGPDLLPREAAFFREARPFGFILFARNVEAPDQLRRLTGALRDAVGYDAPVLVDQEGGRVQRLRAPHWREWMHPLDQVEAAGRGAARAQYLRARIIADELRAVGIDANCAPTCDVARPETHPFLRNRCYGTTAAQVTQNARATAEGFLDGGVLPVMKHMPGHGLGKVDSHKALPFADADPATLETTDFAPFRALNDLPLGMTAHIVLPHLSDRPATQSPEVIGGVIRGSIGFDGLLMTDDISMQALGGSMAERTRLSLDAGCDVVLHCHADPQEMEDVAATAGMLTGRAAERADRALGARRAPGAIDMPALEAELAGILKDPA
ncbi:glycoside hydrolase family 3 N-terminal domain-containing protein [Oceaniglobus roseus]|uniref:glycoside hydrolase family 3 N-terminal domain-containing protein n=1 Tax=Oceaniglobus roseus TaxID=1737570 RepID=UPI000C7F6FC2|nr:glycoside hydrolase family 3 N-terminal domain-containing protein [Kandeliimicrobium roseum]